MLKNIEALAEKFNNVEEVKQEIKRVQSIKCRLLKQKAREDYAIQMAKVLEEEQTLKEVRSFFEPKEKPVTQFTQEDIDVLNYDETIKAIKSIQSKKCLSQFLTPKIEDNVEYKKACDIEALLIEHKKRVRPIEASVVKKSDIHNLIDHLQTLDEQIGKDYIVDLLQKLLTKEVE
jgi:hypothetical protein